MTAPLPPLPEPDAVSGHNDNYGEKCWTRKRVRAFAKLAVRDALELAAVNVWSAGMNEHNKAAGLPCDARTTGSRCADAIRAMIEEYK